MGSGLQPLAAKDRLARVCAAGDHVGPANRSLERVDCLGTRVARRQRFGLSQVARGDADLFEIANAGKRLEV